MTRSSIDFFREFELSEGVKAELYELLVSCFPDTDYNGRIYFKQLPHHRLILKVENKIVGHLAIDYRVMNLNNALIKVFGVVDLAVHPKFQGNGFGTKMMQELEKIANEHKNNIDFIFLVTHKPLFYERLGYKKTIQKVSWLKIHQGINYGMGNEQVDDCFLMFKNVSNLSWEDGDLDMLGYWY